MDNPFSGKFPLDLIIKIQVQESQFEQWLQVFFFLNNELSEKNDFIYQDVFYIKLYELLTEGLTYATDVITILRNGQNLHKRTWYQTLVTGLENLKKSLSESEWVYLEYRRHNICHIFQNQYEPIQENGTIKKERKGIALNTLQDHITGLITTHSSDREIDFYLNGQLQPQITKLHQTLIDFGGNTETRGG